jgi:GTP pyrophosphokinase
LNSIKTELEELCFKFIYPYRYKVLAHRIDKRYSNLKEIIIQTQNEIEHRLAQESLSEVKISGRKKETYSIYKKMMIKHVPQCHIRR